MDTNTDSTAEHTIINYQLLITGNGRNWVKAAIAGCFIRPCQYGIANERVEVPKKDNQKQLEKKKTVTQDNQDHKYT